MTMNTDPFEQMVDQRYSGVEETPYSSEDSEVIYGTGEPEGEINVEGVAEALEDLE